MNFFRYFNVPSDSFGSPTFGILFFILMVWSLVWKGLALWKAARRGNRNWFIALLAVNTLGILDILYIYVFSKDAKSKNLEPRT